PSCHWEPRSSPEHHSTRKDQEGQRTCRRYRRGVATCQSADPPIGSHSAKITTASASTSSSTPQLSRLSSCPRRDSSRGRPADRRRTTRGTNERTPAGSCCAKSCSAIPRTPGDLRCCWRCSGLCFVAFC